MGFLRVSRMAALDGSGRSRGDPIVYSILSATPWRRSAPCAMAAVLLSACGGGGPPEFPPPDVSVATVVQRAITEWDDYTGRVEAVDSVEIRPRVAGYLAGVHFREGALVDTGDLLFTIDDREYVAAVAAARADLARGEARAAVARQELARAEQLIEARAVSQGELEARQAEQRQAEADVLAARARLTQAELDVSFTRIRAPVAGRAGEARVKPGNLLNPGETLLTTIVSVDPVYVSFEGDERAYLRYQRIAREGGRPSSRDARNPVLVGLASEQGYPHRGEMDFVDNALNPSTGTIRGRAVVPNPEGILTPGLFARVRLLGASRDNALLIHEQALLTDQDRRYVYVLGEGNVALRRDVVLGPQVEGLRVVEQGLAAGDRVIVNGVRRIFFPGQPVNPREVPMDQPDAAPAGQPGADQAESAG
jgi:membrane fusion protein, multidrug efflux system